MSVNYNGILATGVSGFIGGHVWAALAEREDVWGAYGSTGPVPLHPERQLPVDLSQPDSLSNVVRELKPRCIIHLAAMAGPAICQNQSLLAWQINNRAVRRMARAAAKLKARVILASSDQVFDGSKGNYREGDRPNPVNVYGETKKAAERSVFSTVENSVVARFNNTYGSPKFGGSSFSEWILGRVKAGERVILFKDQYRSPIDVTTLVNALIELIDNPFQGLLHLGGANRVNRLTFGRKLIEFTRGDLSLIAEAVSSDLDPQGFMPRDTSFDITLARQVLHTRLPGIEEGIRLVYDREEI